MSAFVKLSINSRQTNYLRLNLGADVQVRPTSTTMGIEFTGSPGITILGGDKHGDALEGTIVKANQKVCISYGQMAPYKFHAKVVANSELAAYGTVQAADIIEPGDEVDIAIYFRAERQVDLATMKWLVRAYLID